MAARRLLIILLVLLGVSTLAAALVPPRSLRDATSSETTTTTTPTEAAPTAAAPVGKHRPVTIEVGGGKIPVVACPPPAERKAPCEPIRVGDRVTLTVKSRQPVQLEIASFGLIGFAAPNAPAIFDLVFDSAADYGIRFTETTPPSVAARIRVLPERAKSRARGEPGPA